VFAEPTIDDFLARIDWHISNALDKAGTEVARVRNEASLAGGFKSGRMVMLGIEAARKAFDGGVDTTLGELKRTIRMTKLDPQKLRELVGQRLTKFAAAAKTTAQIDNPATGGLADYSQEKFTDFDKYLQFSLRQFDVGFHDAPEPEVPPMTSNSINVGNMTGNIQQGSPGATQTFELKANIGTAQAALQAFEAELNKSEIDDRARQELAADIATIKAQLSKPSPSVSILHEAGKSVRNVVEGVVAGALTSPLLHTAIALGLTLGLK
jgi:hypothetical protein